MKDIVDYIDFYPKVLSEAQKMSMFVILALIALIGNGIWLSWKQSQQNDVIQIQASFIDTLRVNDSLKILRLVSQDSLLQSQRGFIEQLRRNDRVKDELLSSQSKLIAVLLTHDSAQMAEDVKKKAAWDSWYKQHQIDIQQHQDWQKEWDQRNK